MTKKGERQSERWSDGEANRAARLWQTNFTDIHGKANKPGLASYRRATLRLIADELGRPFGNVLVRFQRYGVGFTPRPMAPLEKTKATPAALAERIARIKAEEGHSLTGILLGDPPPGFSALDQKRSAHGTKASARMETEQAR